MAAKNQPPVGAPAGSIGVCAAVGFPPRGDLFAHLDPGAERPTTGCVSWSGELRTGGINPHLASGGDADSTRSAVRLPDPARLERAATLDMLRAGRILTG